MRLQHVPVPPTLVFLWFRVSSWLPIQVQSLSGSVLFNRAVLYSHAYLAHGATAVLPFTLGWRRCSRLWVDELLKLRSVFPLPLLVFGFVASTRSRIKVLRPRLICLLVASTEI